METHKSIRLDTIVVRTAGLDTADLDGEKVMMDINKGKYYALNSVGSCIWETIVKPVPASYVVAKLMDEYRVNADTCREDVLSFLDRLYNEGLVCVD